jgi:DNA (cytosine-5)-methyltransferase 1
MPRFFNRTATRWREALRFIKDDRRQLYREFLRYVGHFKPRVFVMENVLGIQSAADGEYFTRVQHEARLLGYRVVAQIADAFALGVPQKRRRQLIVGVRGDLPGFFSTQLAPAPRALVGTTLGSAICDLPRLEAGGGVESVDYDFARRERHLAYWRKPARNYLYRVCEVTRASKLTAHRARPHSARDLGDFLLLREGENSATAMREGVEFEFPYDKSSFKDRYTRQSRRKPCSTIVAHLSKDGLMFIHPTQNRSLTPREAARIQSFPDWFQFPVARTHQFRIIGNAVPPWLN